MAERRSRESNWRRGWPSIIVVALVVVAAGFAVGVVAGITWEEPELVAGYLSGQTEGIDWAGEAEAPEAGDGAIPEPPSVAAPPPLGLREAPDAAVLDPVRTKSGTGVTAVRKVAPAAPKPAAGFAVQVGAFSEKSAALALADSLRANGYRVYLSPTEGDPASWRVRVGPLGTRPEAEKTARRLESAEKLPTWVLGEDS